MKYLKNKKILIILSLSITLVFSIFFIKNMPYTGIYIYKLKQFEPIDHPYIAFANQKNIEEYIHKSKFVKLEVPTIDLKQYLGKVVIVNYWAEWCNFCIKELPKLNKLANYDSDKLKIINISTDKVINNDYVSLISNIKSLYKKLEINNLEIFHDSKNLKIKNFGQGVPYSIIINPKGKAVANVRGSINWGNKNVIKLINYHYNNN